MKEEIKIKIWVLRFCIKVIYPKLNPYTFLVYLAIKSNYYFYRRSKDQETMNAFTLKAIPSYILPFFAKEHSKESNLPVCLHKCIFISQANFIQLSVENLFYRDNGLLWVVIKLTKEENKNFEDRKLKGCTDNSIFKYNLNLRTSAIHKKLWKDSTTANCNNTRIVPVISSPYIHDNIILVCENEFYNILSSFDINNRDTVNVSFHPVPALEYSPKIAAAAEVSLIVNDFDLSNDFIKEILSNHFEEPRLVSENDLITIDLNPLIMAKYHYKYLDLVESMGKLSFKCNNISSDVDVNVSSNQSRETVNNVVKAFYVVKGVTQLTLGENIHSIRPKNRFIKPHTQDGQYSHLLHLCPAGLRCNFDQIQEAISPFLTGEISDLTSSLSTPILPMFLITGVIGSGRHLLVKTLARYNGVNCLQFDCNAVQSSTAKQTESKISLTIQKAKAAAPAIVLLDNFEVFAVDPENNEDHRVMEYFMNSITDLYENYTKHPIIFFAISEKVDLKPNIMRIFLDKFHLPKLNVQRRYEMLEWFTAVMLLDISNAAKKTNEINIDVDDVSGASVLSNQMKEVLQRVASKTETFVYGDLDTLIHFALRESYLKQHSYNCPLSQDPNLHLVKEEDFDSALESIRSLKSQHLDAPKIPKVYWDDIGGLEKLKKELLKTIEFPIKFPHLFKNSTLKRSGILLYGPPGCGKTLVAKAVSTELNVSFLSVKGPELLNMYIGQSEENVRKVFESARASSPCIVFLDELDALAPRRGAAGDSGGASDRVVSQLLAEVDGVSEEDSDKSSFVFIMGATNRPDLLEQSLLRPGRLDKLIYVGPYCGTREKTSVLNALCRNERLRPEVDLAKVAEALPERCTGADLMQVVSSARSAAVRSLVSNLTAGLVKESDLSQDSVIIGASELLEGVESFRPSVTEEELAYYESLQYQI